MAAETPVKHFPTIDARRRGELMVHVGLPQSGDELQRALTGLKDTAFFGRAPDLALVWWMTSDDLQRRLQPLSGQRQRKQQSKKPPAKHW